jgi:hypothetical protein
MKFLNLTRIKTYEVIADTTNYFRRKFNLANFIFSYTTAYGQIILAVTDIVQVFFTYLQDVAVENNILQAKRVHSIYGMAKLTGHDPMRGASAFGDIELILKAEYPPVKMNTIYLYNYMRIRCNENGLTYMLDLGTDLMPIILGSAVPNIKIIEGQFEVQFFQGTGEDLQSFNVKVPAGRYIEHNKVLVSINGQNYDKIDSIYDFTYGEKNFICKTGLKGGVDLFFGRNNDSNIPKLGEQIRVDYLMTNGRLGNIDELDFSTFSFIDNGYDILGNEINLNSIFSIKVNNTPQFGADPEDVELTRNLISLASRNKFLHDEKSIKYYFKKMNLYSYVDVRNEYVDGNGQFIVTLIPDVLQKTGLEVDSFNINLGKFLLSDNHITRLLNFTEKSGEKSLSVSIDIENAIIKRYVLYLIVYVFRNKDNYIVNDITTKREIKSIINAYTIKNVRTRHNVIPHSDIVRIIDEIPFVDSVKAIFVGEENEVTGGDKVGFNEIGDIVVEKNELPLIRGGWKDRNGVFYEDDFDIQSSKMQSVNVIINYID